MSLLADEDSCSIRVHRREDIGKCKYISLMFLMNQICSIYHLFQSDDTSLVLQIAPTIYHQCEAMILILERYNWTDFSIVTTKDMGTDFIDCMEKMVRKTSIEQGYLIKPR